MLGESSPLGYSDDLRPPGDIPGRAGAAPPCWPVRPAEAAPVQQQAPYPSRVLPEYQPRPGQSSPRAAAPDQPVSLEPPGVTDQANGVPATYDFSAALRCGAITEISAAAREIPGVTTSRPNLMNVDPSSMRPQHRATRLAASREPLRDPPVVRAPRAAVGEPLPADIPSRREPPPVVPLGTPPALRRPQGSRRLR
jgi:hypothetical protein